MTLHEIANLRLINQQLGATTMNAAVEMVEWFAAVQGQEYAQTKWGLGLRLPQLKDDDIEEELSQGKILRTHILRPTWHFVVAKDIRWMLTLSAPRVHIANAFMYRKSGLDKKFFNKCNKVIIKALQGTQLTRNEINDALKKHKINAEGLRLIYIMMNAELESILSSGARRGNQFTYALLDEIVPQKNSFNKDEALTELTKRYFKSRGPATIKDFSTWSGLTIADCKKGIANLPHLLEKELIEGNEYYFSRDTRTIHKKPKPVFLLPIYDEYIMGYKDRSAIMQHKNSISGSAVRYNNMIVYDGQVIGTWTRTIEKNAIVFKYGFFGPLNKSNQKLFNNAVIHLEKFSGMKVSY